MADSDDDDNTCFTCCCSPCIGLCYLFCLKSMRISTRLKIVWIWMISLSLFSGLYIRYNLYDEDIVSISSHDMMTVQKMSTFFCEGVTLKSNSKKTPLAVYRLNSEPGFNRTHAVYNSSELFPLLVNTKKRYHYYLMAGSSITMKFCTKESVLLVVVQGTEKYNNYITTHDRHKYTDNFITVHSGCNKETFDIHETDRYYFLISQNWRSSKLYLQTILYKTSYEVHGKDSHLELVQWEVYVPLKFQSTETIVYQPVLETYQDVTVTTTCEPMNYLYVGIFLGGFLTLGLILSYLVKCLSKDPLPDSPSAEPPANASVPLSTSEPALADQIHPTAPPLPEDESSTPWFPTPGPPPPVGPPPACPPPAYDSLFSNTAYNEPPPYMSTTIELKGNESYMPMNKL